MSQRKQPQPTFKARGTDRRTIASPSYIGPERRFSERRDFSTDADEK